MNEKIYNTHIEQMNHNKNFISFGISNSKESFLDWEIVAYFYTAVHLIEAVLCKECGIVSVNSHQERKEYICDFTNVFSHQVQRDYIKLIALAHKARYTGFAVVSEQDGRNAQMWLENMEFALSTYV